MCLILAVKKVEISEVISTVLLVIPLTLKKADLQDENMILSAASNFHSFSFSENADNTFNNKTSNKC